MSSLITNYLQRSAYVLTSCIISTMIIMRPDKTETKESVGATIDNEAKEAKDNLSNVIPLKCWVAISAIITETARFYSQNAVNFLLERKFSYLSENTKIYISSIPFAMGLTAGGIALYPKTYSSTKRKVTLFFGIFLPLSILSAKGSKDGKLFGALASVYSIPALGYLGFKTIQKAATLIGNFFFKKTN
ncbi:MAG: hypothetical protein JXA94_07190 [Parachlamydiales bacterium]|nr:hypothetical protein [Parachlamydiales bacterium]